MATRIKPGKDKRARDGKTISVKDEIEYKKNLQRRSLKRPLPEKELPFTAILRKEGKEITYLDKSQVNYFSLEVQKRVPDQEWVDEVENLIDEKRRFELYWRKKQLSILRKAKWLLYTREGKRIKSILEDKKKGNKKKFVDEDDA